ncbi:MAG TPA: capsular biosynthesis protein [Pseudomonadales bacterium]
MGPFFRRLRRALRAKGAEVYKVNFCGGDALFYPTGAISYRGTLEEWPSFVGNLIDARQIDALMLFGDCRPHHALVTRLARARGLPVYVFEEGYLRPDFVTVELGGTNSFSSLPRDPEVYRRFSPHPATRVEPQRVRHVFRWAAIYASLYTLATFALRWRFPHYRHHRPLRPSRELVVWVRSGLRKLLYRWTERGLLSRLTAPDAPPFFLVPLQVHGDAQIRVHSDFQSVPTFIETVLASFARHAPPDRLLVFKHHPLDRGYTHYGRLIRDLAQAHGVADRTLYVHDLHLPRLLDAACGTVVVNSTVGLSSVHHGTPVHVMGRANYDLPGLSHQGTLDEFWSAPGEPDHALYRNFRAWLCAYNQANGNFYSPLPGCSDSAGLRWPPLFPAPSAGHDRADDEQPMSQTVSV